MEVVRETVSEREKEDVIETVRETLGEMETATVAATVAPVERDMLELTPVPAPAEREILAEPAPTTPERERDVLGDTPTGAEVLRLVEMVPEQSLRTRALDLSL